MTLTVGVTPPYPVVIEAGLLSRLNAHIAEDNVVLVSDTNVAAHYAEVVRAGLESAGKTVTRLTVAPGEESKTLATYGNLLRELAQRRIDRGAAVLALGGGVVGDLAGFVAASYLRGVAFDQIPTSLLAMVDASVGGKTGLNLPEGKNLVGAFWQPKAVLMDVTTLRTLPEREFRGGAVELFKHGLLADPELLEHLPSDGFRRDGDPDFLAQLIGRSVAVKAKIVAADEREGGERAHLNLGHTLAHALEAHSHHRIPHGDTVAYGLLFVAELAARRGYADETGRMKEFLRWVNPVPLGVEDDITFDALLPYLYRDKKVQGGRLRWVLLERIGKPLLVDDVQESELRRAWDALLATLPGTLSDTSKA